MVAGIIVVSTEYSDRLFRNRQRSETLILARNSIHKNTTILHLI